MLASIKGRNSVANLRKTTIYNTNVDLVNDDVYTKFGLIINNSYTTSTHTLVSISTVSYSRQL